LSRQVLREALNGFLERVSLPKTAVGRVRLLDLLVPWGERALV
jgi:hypothetical protein